MNKKTGRSGKLFSTNDDYIEELLNDERYRVHPDGMIETIITVAGNISVNKIWRDCRSLTGNKETKNRYYSVSYTSPSSDKRLKLQSHRITYAKFGSKPLENDLVISHLNDIGIQNNIENLDLVTASDNNLQAYKNGRKPNYGNSNLSDEIADEIRTKYNSGISLPKLAVLYDISKSDVSYILNGITWYRNQKVFCEVRGGKSKVNFPMAELIREKFESRNGETGLMKRMSKERCLGLTLVKDIIAKRRFAKPSDQEIKSAYQTELSAHSMSLVSKSIESTGETLSSVVPQDLKDDSKSRKHQ